MSLKKHILSIFSISQEAQKSHDSFFLYYQALQVNTYTEKYRDHLAKYVFFFQSPLQRATHVGISSVNSRVARTVKVFRSSLNLSLKQSGLLLPNAQHSQLSTISETKWTTSILPKAQHSQLSTDAPNLPGSDITNAHNSQFYRKQSFAVHFSSTFNSIFQPFFSIEADILLRAVFSQGNNSHWL